MPWRELSTMEQRLQFVTEYQSGVFTMLELAAEYGITPKTGYKWVHRYEVDGVQGLHDRSRQPAHSPHAFDAAVRDELLALRGRHAHWGARKLLAVAARHRPGTAWPSRATVCRWLKQRGLVASRRPRRVAHGLPRPLVRMTEANQVWTTDFKGEFRTGDGQCCYPLTLRDGYSRFVLRCDALADRSYAATRRGFERAFAAFGLPERIRSDNGAPFASTGFARLSRLAVWWMRLGIVPERIALGRPDQNGSHEQFHRVLKAATARPPAATGRAQQQRFRRFCHEYNHERPHEALENAVPADRYQPSPRALPRQLPVLEYPGHFEVRGVTGMGHVSWGGDALFLSETLAGERIGFEEVADGLWTVFFGTVALGRFDERHRQLQPLAPIAAGRGLSTADSAPDRKN